MAAIKCGSAATRRTRHRPLRRPRAHGHDHRRAALHAESRTSARPPPTHRAHRAPCRSVRHRVPARGLRAILDFADQHRLYVAVSRRAATTFRDRLAAGENPGAAYLHRWPAAHHRQSHLEHRHRRRLPEPGCTGGSRVVGFSRRDPQTRIFPQRAHHRLAHQRSRLGAADRDAGHGSRIRHHRTDRRADHLCLLQGRVARESAGVTMAISGADLTCTPNQDAIDRLAEAWAWLLKEPFVPVLFTALGDMFFEPDTGGVWWLNTGTAELTRVADSVDDFHEKLGDEIASVWLMPALVEQLHAAGKIPEPGECYTYVTLPVFAEGRYEVDNLNPVPAGEHFSVTGHILHEIAELPDEAKATLHTVQ